MSDQPTAVNGFIVYWHRKYDNAYGYVPVPSLAVAKRYAGILDNDTALDDVRIGTIEWLSGTLVLATPEAD